VCATCPTHVIAHIMGTTGWKTLHMLTVHGLMLS
jgi:hypothetical protein